ncbi:HAMP domain-containing sensor histidine kinase [Tissierella sp. Yu-01]|uniref:sensor histidine kinase n=1 Tax=Tissierella sp. Yu-01 TaxID=3035694 RepID=UPI00240D8E97|nr:HAMP domain-containing sensor histidine kinase [Tissierella sp. Yu-01]WFA08884.1 HAMP domain-containing sensor histidine kinase [Tissierella sp. Yu-01]
MLRNKDYRNLLITMIGISIIGTAIISTFNILAGIFIAFVFILLICSSIFFTLKRYKDIEKLSEYLRTISSGDYSLDIRDNVEGELSILKNEIYKVTLILSKHGEYEKREKELLADSISDISHQLKTPLTSMMVMTDLLSNSNLEVEKRMEFTKNIQAQLDRMEWLLTSLLKLSKIDAGTIIFKRDKVNVKDLIQKAINPLLIPLELKDQNIIIEGDSEVVFTGDANWTVEAIINIVKNCIEHTNKGGYITISFEENPLYTEIKISDNGIGINKEDLPYIFKRFYRGKNAGNDSVGIGLAMAKSIIESQNGDLTVKSRKNEGTQFSIKFYKQTV